jgi:hypothetical protein
MSTAAPRPSESAELGECIIADALIDQSKRRSANCPCSGRVTAHPEVVPKKCRSVRIGDNPPGTHRARVLVSESPLTRKVRSS